MAKAVERTVGQVTPQQKMEISTKANKLGLPISELMRRGAIANETEMVDQKLMALADKAEGAAKQACVCIDDALAFIESSNRRIA